MHGRNTQVARIYRILNLLEGSHNGLSAAELRERLNDRDVEVSKRTVYRDLEALSDAGFPLYPVDDIGDESATRWVLERSARISQYLVFSAQELFALYLARGMLVPLKDTPLHSDLEGVFQKIADKLGTVNREHFTELSSEIRFDASPNWGLGLNLEVLDAVRAACAEGQVLSVDYESVSSGTQGRRRLGPHYVYFAKGSGYLIAEDLATAQTKVFALPRMKNAVMEDEVYKGKPVDHEKFFGTSFGVFHGEQPLEVRIEFTKAVAHYVKERRWHSSQKTVPASNGGIQLTMQVALTPELVQWVLGFGPEAQVLGPEDLRVKLGDSISKMAGLYDEKRA